MWKSVNSILFQAARIIAKLAAWGRELMEGSDLNYYFNWIKTQLSSQVKSYFCLSFTRTLHLKVWIKIKK